MPKTMSLCFSSKRRGTIKSIDRMKFFNALRRHSHAIYSDINVCKNDNFQLKIFNYFHIVALNIDCGYMLEPP